MAFGVPRHPRPAFRNDHLQVVRVVRAIAQFAFQAPRPHFEPGAATDIEAVVEALERLRVLSGERPDPLGMAVICYGLQVCPAALGADIETARQQLRPSRNGESRENPHHRYCGELEALSHNASPMSGLSRKVAS